MKFSIIIPFFTKDNVRKLYLSKCLDSLLKQDFRDFEIIIVGDDIKCPTNVDGINIINIKYENHLEWSKMMNIAVEEANGQYLLFWQSDFIVYPSHLRLLGFHIRQHNNALYTGRIIDVRSDDNKVDIIDSVRYLCHYYEADHLDACIKYEDFESFYEGFFGTHTHWYVEWLARMSKKLDFLAFRDLETIHLPHDGNFELKQLEGEISNNLYQKCMELNFEFEKYSILESLVEKNKKEILKLNEIL